MHHLYRTAHLVRPSILPLAFSFSLGGFLFTTALQFHYGNSVIGKVILVTLNLLFLIALVKFVFRWFNDVSSEGYLEGAHTTQVEDNLRYGMLLFIFSEVMFFFSFFWAFFHSSLAPTIEIGSMWPPQDILIIETWNVPLTNTAILLTSGIVLTIAHKQLTLGDNRAMPTLLLVVILGVIFTLFQADEYYKATYTLKDGIYPTCFYLLTGFHGAHVIIGTLFLFISYIRLCKGQFTKQRHFGFIAAAWYWHFVDVVWLFLFIFVYWWGNS